MSEHGGDFLKATSLKKSRHSEKLLCVAFASALVDSARAAGSAICAGFPASAHPRDDCGGFCNLRGLSRKSAKNFPREVKLNS